MDLKSGSMRKETKMSQDPDKSFETFRHIRTEHNGNITVALKVFPNKQDMLAGFAFCSPNEKNFSKKRGRTIAKERMIARPLLVETVSGKTLVYALLLNLFKMPDVVKNLIDVPRWIPKMLREKGFTKDKFAEVQVSAAMDK